MKRTGWGILCAGCFTAVGGWAWGEMERSKHDFSKQPWSGGETCGVCHTPHQSAPPKAAPLWDPSADLSRVFGSSASHNAAGTGTTLCLRCHDGTLARDTFNVPRDTGRGGGTHVGVFDAAHGGSNHPVGVVYPELRKGYRPVVAVLAKGTVTLPNNRVECVSCHDPHAAADVDRLLVMSNSRSALCLTCHQK